MPSESLFLYPIWIRIPSERDVEFAITVLRYNPLKHVRFKYKSKARLADSLVLCWSRLCKERIELRASVIVVFFRMLVCLVLGNKGVRLVSNDLIKSS